DGTDSDHVRAVQVRAQASNRAGPAAHAKATEEQQIRIASNNPSPRCRPRDDAGMAPIEQPGEPAMTVPAFAPPVFRSLLTLALVAACGVVAAQVIVTPPPPREGEPAPPPAKRAGVVVTPPAARNKATVVVPPATR